MLDYSGNRMKKKPLAQPIIAPEIMDLARRAAAGDRPKPVKRCVVCGNERSAQGTVPSSFDEDLCWVCRRLKISAWHEAEGAPAQE